MICLCKAASVAMYSLGTNIAMAVFMTTRQALDTLTEYRRARTLM